MIKSSILILTKNAGSEFEKTLKMIFSQKYDEEYEVIMIDSGSKDDTLTIAKNYQTKIYEIPPEEFGHAKTRNFVANLSKGDYLVFITQDAVPFNNRWLENLTKPLSNPKIAGVYGRQTPKGNANPMEKFFLSQFYPKKREIKYTNKNTNEKNIFFSNVNSAIRKDIWKKHKFSNDLIMSEDQEWAKRILSQRYKLVYEPKASVFHSHNYSLKTVFQRYFDSGASLQEFASKEYESSKFLSEGVRYFKDEIKFLYKGYKKWIPYAILYDFCKFSGMLLGKKEKYIPIVIKKRLSLYKVY